MAIDLQYLHTTTTIREQSASKTGMMHQKENGINSDLPFHPLRMRMDLVVALV